MGFAPPERRPNVVYIDQKEVNDDLIYDRQGEMREVIKRESQEKRGEVEGEAGGTIPGLSTLRAAIRAHWTKGEESEFVTNLDHPAAKLALFLESVAEDDAGTVISEDFDEADRENKTIVENIQNTDLTQEVIFLSPSTSTGSTVSAPVTPDVLVEFDPAPCVRHAFISRGFLHYGPSQHEGGRERRSLLTISDRDSVNQSLEEIREEYDVQLEVERITSTSPPSSIDSISSDGLSPWQRKAFQLARAHGYYEYPRYFPAVA